MLQGRMRCRWLQRGQPPTVAAIGKQSGCRGVRWSKKAVLVLACILPAAPPSLAKDLDKLTRALSPMFLAEDFASVCAAVDPSFYEATRGERGTIHYYVQHTKLEVIDQLAAADAEIVLKRAADAAKFLAVKRTNEIAPQSLEADADRVRRWCDAVVKDFVQRVMREHDASHDEFLASLAKAKQD